MNNLMALGVTGVVGFVLYDYFINPPCKHWIPLFNLPFVDPTCTPDSIPVAILGNKIFDPANSRQGESLRRTVTEALENLGKKAKGSRDGGTGATGIGRSGRDSGSGSGASGSRSGGSGASGRAKADDSFLDVYRQIQEAAEEAQLSNDAQQNLGALISAAILGPTIPFPTTSKGKKLNPPDKQEKTTLEKLIDNAIKNAKDISTQENALFQLFAGIHGEARTDQIRSNVLAERLAQIAGAGNGKEPYCGPKPEPWDIIGNLQRGACILGDAISNQAATTQRQSEINARNLGIPQELARLIRVK